MMKRLAMIVICQHPREILPAGEYIFLPRTLMVNRRKRELAIYSE